MRVAIEDVVAVFVGSRESVLEEMDSEHSWRRESTLICFFGQKSIKTAHRHPISPSPTTVEQED